MRTKSFCYCHKVKEQPQSLTEEELISQSFSFRLEKRTQELEKELSSTKEALTIEQEEVAKFHEKSKEWGDEKIKRIKELEAEVTKLKEENQHLKEQQNGQVAQIEVKETKKWSWLKLRK